MKDRGTRHSRCYWSILGGDALLLEAENLVWVYMVAYSSSIVATKSSNYKRLESHVKGV